MPNANTMILPKTKNYEEFESMCLDVLNILDSDHVYEKYGKKGQKQDGIDLTTTDKSYVAQCKNYNSPKNFLTKIDKDIESAKKKFGNLRMYTIMTSLDRNTKIQDHFSNFSIKGGKLKNKSGQDIYIRIYFWDDIEETIGNNEKLLNKYYKDFLNNKIDIKIIPEKKLVKLIGYLEYALIVAEYFHTQAIINMNYDLETGQIHCKFAEVTMLKLYKLKNKYRFQLYKIGIYYDINKMIEITPEIVHIFDDEVGSYVVDLSTIYDYTNFFSDPDKYKLYISLCENIIDKTEQYYKEKYPK